MGILKSIWDSKSNRTVVDNYASMLLIQAANIILPLAILPYLIRILGVEKYGVVILAQSFCTIIYVFVEFGFNLSATRRISIAKDHPEERSRIFSAVLAVKGLLLVGMFFIFSIIVLSFTRFNVEWEVYFLSFGVVVGQAIFPDWFFQGIERMRFIAAINVVAKVIFTALIFMFVHRATDYALVPLFNSTGYILAGFVSLFISLRYTKFIKPSKQLMRDLVSESTTLFVSNFAARLFNSANVFIVGLVAGDATAGIYGAMEKIFIASKSFFSPLVQAIYPWLANKKADVQRSNIIKLVPFVVLLALVFTLTVFLFGEHILEFIFDKKAITFYSTAFKILAVGTVFAAINMMFLSLYFPAAGYYKSRMNILLMGGVFNVVIAFVLVTLFGIYGIIFAVITTELLLAVVSYIHFKKI